MHETTRAQITLVRPSIRFVLTYGFSALIVGLGFVSTRAYGQAADSTRATPNSVAENWIRLREVKNSILAAIQLRVGDETWANDAKNHAENDEDNPADARTERAVEANYRAVAKAAREELDRLRPEAALLEALVGDNAPIGALPPDLQNRADRVTRDSVQRADLTGLWATPRGSLVRMQWAGSKLLATYVSRVREDPQLVGDTVFDGQALRGQVWGKYYATYPAKRAEHIAKCIRELSEDLVPKQFFGSSLQLDVAADGQSLTGLSGYEPGGFASDCDRGPTNIAYDVIRLRRVADSSAKVEAIAMTGDQADEALPKNEGGGFWSKVRAGIIIAGAVTAASKGDTVTSNTLIGYLVGPTSAANGNGNGVSGADEPTASAATAVNGTQIPKSYVGPYENEVTHLLYNPFVSGWKFSSCATCTDFVFPVVRINKNSQRDTYVAKAVMEAYAAAAHAHVGKPHAAEDNARSMHDNLQQANALCSNGARSVSSSGSGPQTLGIWGCPPPM